MNIWRIHLKTAAQKGVDQRQLCIDNNIFGVGWQIGYKNVPVSWEEYHASASKMYNDKSWTTALNAIKNRIKIDDLIWTRDWHGNYYLGRVIGDWYYDTSKECSEADIVNVRKCEWHKIGTIESVPGAVINGLRSSRTVQIINDKTSCIFSQIVYNKKVGKEFYKVDNSNKDIFSLLSDKDCEDVLAIFLQVKYNYYIIPSSCKKDTMAYEFVLQHRETGNIAVAQVKSGNVPLNSDNYNNIEHDVFLFATSGVYHGSTKKNIKTIDPKQIRNFLNEQTHLLPNNLKVWVEFTRVSK